MKNPSKASGRGIVRVVVAINCAISLLFLTGCPTPTPPVPHATGAKTLNATPVLQQTVEWCWAASAQMIFQYNGLPPLNTDFQCGIVAAYFGPYSACWSNCLNCITSIGSVSDFQTLIDDYGSVCNQLNVPSKSLTSTLLFRALSIDEIAFEINNNRVIFAGISPQSFSYPNVAQHATVIVGYDATGSVPEVIVNDPWPYDLPYFNSTPNPYLSAGGTEINGAQFKIPLAEFVYSLQYANTIYQIH